MAENHIQFVWERPKADQYDRTSHTKYMRTTTGAGGKKYGPIGHLRRHSTPWEVSGDACRVRWSGVAINATNRVHQCVFFPLSYWIHGGAAGDEYIWLFPTSAAMLDHSTRHAPPHRSCGRRWRTGRASGPYFFPLAWGWSACILYGRYGHIGRLSVSPIQIVWGFPPYVLYGQTSAYFQKWTGGGKTTLITIPETKTSFFVLVLAVFY